MKIIIALLAVVTAINTSYAQYKETRKIEIHDKISVATGIHVEYIKSNKNELIIESEKKEYIDRVSTNVEHNKLFIKYKPNTKIKNKKPTKITIYSVYELNEAKVTSSGVLIIKDPIDIKDFKLDASSSGKIITNQIKANKVEVDASSSAKIETQLVTDDLEIDASSSGKIKISGSANNVEVDMSSSASIDLTKTKITNLKTEGSSSGKLYINTANSIENNLSSSAKVFYQTEPTKINKNKTSSGGKMQKQ